MKSTERKKLLILLLIFLINLFLQNKQPANGSLREQLKGTVEERYFSILFK